MALPDGRPMANASRRSFLRGIVGVSAIVALPVVAAPCRSGTFALLAWVCEGGRLIEAQRLDHQMQLDLITGGVGVDLFIAQKQREAVAELRKIRAALERF